MTRKHILIGAAFFALAALLSVAAAAMAVTLIEQRALRDVSAVLADAGQDWAGVAADGLQVHVSGTAPDERRRFQALSAAGGVVDPDRVIDRIAVAEGEAIAPPRFSIEILRSGKGVSLIGLVPGEAARARVTEAIAAAAGDAPVADLLESADHGVPEGWDDAVGFAAEALSQLARAKISVAPGAVTVTANTDSAEEKRRIEAALARAAPRALKLALSITAPRPVITPFSLRFVLDADGARFDSCSADTEEARAAILTAAAEAGFEGKAQCVIGLGAPSPRWGAAAARAIAALAGIGGGQLTFADADITLIAPAGTDQQRFDTAMARLEADLPDVFVLNAVLPPAPVEEGTAPRENEFSAILDPDGGVALRGRVTDARTQEAMRSFAAALFGAARVDDTTRTDPGLPAGWPLKVLTGIEALAQLHDGRLVIRPGRISLRGISASPDARSRITRLFSEKLDTVETYDIAVTYDEALDPLANLPTPEECVARIGAVLAEGQITFAPGEGTLDEGAGAVLDRIAEILKDCAEVAMRIEIGGHTDSQGRESMNLALSQARAEAVLDALLSRAVLTTNMSAKGYGESRPIADNDTEEGREANRRIEFRLIGPEEAAGGTEDDAAPESADATGEGENADEQN